MADSDLLDEIKNGFGLKNDSELAGFLGVTRALIHNARFVGNRKLGKRARLLVLDRIAYLRVQTKVGQWVGAITNESLADRLIESANGLAQRRAIKHMPIDGAQVAEKDLIEVAKHALGCETDEELSKMLEISPSTISSVRNGRGKLGVDPRLAILNKIEKFDVHKLKNTLENTEELIEAIRAWAQQNKSE